MKIVKFYMRGGHVVTATKVKEISITRDKTTGAYCGYHIVWEDDGIPAFFTLSIPDIVAVVAEIVE